MTFLYLRKEKILFPTDQINTRLCSCKYKEEQLQTFDQIDLDI